MDYYKQKVKRMIAFMAMIDSIDDQQAFELIYTKNCDLLYRCAYRVLQDEAASEDAVHDAFLSLAKNYDRYKHMNSSEMRSFMIITVRNAAFRIYNKRKREFAAEEVRAEEMLPDISVETENKDVKRIIFDMVKQLDSKYSDVIMLKYFCELSISDIAESLGLSEENVKVRLYRARAALKKKLEEVGING